MSDPPIRPLMTPPATTPFMLLVPKEKEFGVDASVNTGADVDDNTGADVDAVADVDVNASADVDSVVWVDDIDVVVDSGVWVDDIDVDVDADLDVRDMSGTGGISNCD